jgi:DNA adenine methylase
MTTAPFSWYGGKQALAPWLVSLLPSHKVYVEVFGGSGALLFAKARSRLEIFNDLDGGVVHFFRVLRDPVQVKALQQALQLTPYAREEYYDCLHHWQDATDPIERARLWYCAVIQTRNNALRATGWRSTKVPASNPARAWVHGIAHLTDFVERLAHVQIDHRDFAQVIAAYDGPETCFYLDPPYLVETRRKPSCYRQEMRRADHERLLSCLTEIQGMALLSGYDHPLYQEALAGWDRLHLDVACPSAVDATIAMTGEYSPAVLRRTECLWRNPACMRQQRTLFAEIPETSWEVHT